ncbi:MAG TPA: SpoIIE family protein phosphatase [Candidatus Cloacimonadota bacterium]|nr:SpoIIE family protein phosphatase [Candidatus Cloacimonadota bacterium]
MNDNDRIKILLIEDDTIDQMAFQRLVKNQNLPYIYQIANSIANARRLISEEEFDIVVADFNLGDGTFFDLKDDLKNTPFIVVTGSGDEEVAVTAMKRGAKDYLIKDNERTYLQLLPITVAQAVKHHKMEQGQIQTQNKIKMLFQAVEQSSTSVIITDPQGSIEYVNPKFEQVTGYTMEEVTGKNPRILKTDYHEKEFYEELWDDVLDGKTWTGEFLNQKKNGLRFWEMATISPVYDDNGNIIHLIAIKEDVTEQKKVKQALEFRVKLENLINQISTNFINLTTNKIDAAVAESLGKIGRFINIDRAFVYSFNQDRGIFVRKYNWFSTSIDVLLDLPDTLTIDNIPWLYNVLQSQDMVFIPSIEMMQPEAAKEKAVLESINSRSIIFFPMLYQYNLMGFVGLCSIQYEKYWDTDTIKLLKTLVEIIVNALQRKQAAEEIENLYNSLKQEIELAASVQTYLVPQWLRYEDDILFSSIYKPSSSIGGDLFDILKISDQKYVVYMGDISGHGVKAALMMTAVKSIIGMLIENEKGNLNPHYIIQRLNKILCRSLFHNDYMTIGLGVIDLAQNEIRYLSAGHPSLIEYDLKTGETVVLGTKGSIPVGWDENFEYKPENEDVIPFRENKVYIMYTDGIFECENPEGNQLGLTGFTRLLEEQTNIDNGIMLPHIFKQRLTDLQYNINSDDFTMLIFQKAVTSQKGKFNKLFLVHSLTQNTGLIATECYQQMIEHLGNEKLATEVELVINEFLNNIIEHGLQSKKDTIIAFRFEIDDKIRMKFVDNGQDWDLPQPEDKNIAKPDKFRGMGMQIIYTIISDIRKNRYDNINETTIEVDI